MSGDSNLPTVWDVTYTVATVSPSLKINKITLTPVAPTVGATFTAAVEVANVGALAGAVGKVAVWPWGYPGAVACGNTTGAAAVVDSSKTTIQPGSTATVSLTGLAAPLKAGNATLGVFIDSSCATSTPVASLQQALVFTPLAPSLSVSSITLTPAT